MFIVIGIITCIIGVATYFILPDSPMSASFLTEVEKTALIKHVSINQTGIENHHFKFSQMLEVLIDPQIWLMTLMTILVRCVNFYNKELANNSRSPSPVVLSQPTRQPSSRLLASPQ
jgi:sugar phosphate permease